MTTVGVCWLSSASPDSGLAENVVGWSLEPMPDISGLTSEMTMNDWGTRVGQYNVKSWCKIKIRLYDRIYCEFYI